MAKKKKKKSTKRKSTAGFSSDSSLARKDRGFGAKLKAKKKAEARLKTLQRELNSKRKQAKKKLAKKKC